MNKKILIPILIIVVVLIVGIIYFMTQKQEIGQLPKFKLTMNTWVGYGPFFLAQDKGFFKDEGIDVKITVNEDVAARKSALLGGSVDGVGDTIDALVRERDEGVLAVTVLEVDESNGADGILVTQGINSIKDLKGRKIFVQRNFVSEAFLQYVLGKNGISLNEVELVDTEAGAAGAAFVAGKADVVVTYEPWLSKAKERAGGKVLISTADEKGVIVDSLSVDEKVLKEQPQDVKKVMRAWFEAVDFWRKNPNEANELMAKHYNMSSQEFSELISGLIWPTYEQNLTYFGTKENPGRIYQVSDIFSDVFLQTKSIKSKPDMAKAIDDSFLRTLYEK